LVAAISELACRSGLANVGSASQVRLTVHQSGEEVIIELDRTASGAVVGSSSWIEEIVGEVAARHVNRPLTIQTKQSNILLRIPYEPVLSVNADVLYSVAY
jgi:hypothetical protein